MRHVEKEIEEDVEEPTIKSVSIQTELTSGKIDEMEQEITSLRQEKDNLQKEVAEKSFDIESFKDNDKTKPSGLKAKAQTWSSYKHHNTVKFLIGITPQGVVSFLSKAWGGRANDKCITENSGFLGHLLPGNLVLADRGFNIFESVGSQHAQLNIPAFTKGKAQLSAVDIETTRKIAQTVIR
ncbi:uncharacterized protein LOC111346570 [Stylophora pistillata]|uniref:uncharacterized protein LOC111346570 n=1 Tax=Stylophora pistillata TaxID=50429 RepID=UPI000C056C62|nr:uncharacterized protein LOC111346570 [Stylophora pistillata]